MYGYLADVVVLVHVIYVAYVIFGQLAIILAAPFRKLWARNPWFRFTHLLAMGIVAVEAVMGWRCPLTVWEEQLRQLGGAEVVAGQTFMGRLLHDLLFIDGMPEIFFTTMYIGMMAIVIQAFIMYPPRWFRQSTARLA